MCPSSTAVIAIWYDCWSIKGKVSCIPMYIFYILLMSSLFIFPNEAPTSVTPWAENYIKARKSAIELNRPYVILFSEVDCTTCKQIKNHFDKSAIQSVMRQSFIGLQVDINDFDGLTLKEYYKVKYLPTLIIFSPKGDILHRYNQVLSEEQLLQALLRPKQNVFPKTDRKRQSPPDATSIQVGVFSKEAGATELKNRLTRLCSISPRIIQDGLHHKVVFGPLVQDRAEKLREKLETYGYSYQVMNEKKHNSKTL